MIMFIKLWVLVSQLPFYTIIPLTFSAMSDAEKAAGKAFISELWSLQGVSYAVVAARYYSRIKFIGWRALSWDDALMGLAIVCHPFVITSLNLE